MNKLDPKSIWLFFFSFVSRGIIPLIFITIFLINLSEIEMGMEIFYSLKKWWWFAIAVYLSICYIWANLSYRFYKYELTEQGFRKESGILYKRYVTIPYEKIQNIDINRGIMTQILGLSDLNIQTAGSSAVMGRGGLISGIGSEGRLPGLSKETAEKIRDELVKRSNK